MSVVEVVVVVVVAVAVVAVVVLRLWFRHWIVGKPILGEFTETQLDCSSALFTPSLFAINRGEFFEIDAIAKERYRMETVRDAINFARGFPAICTRKNWRRAIPVDD
jgi:hypothetical protein